MCRLWQHKKLDAKNIRAIHNRFGVHRRRTFPFLSFTSRQWYHSFWRIEHVRLLDLIDYDKEAAARLLSRELEWRPYGYKHAESTFTWFYQHYILPRKFSIDKRRAHLSALIVSGQLDRDHAVEELKKPLMTAKELEVSREYVTKKLGFTEQEFEAYLSSPCHSHYDYPSEWPSYFRRRRVVSALGKFGSKLLGPFLG